MVQLDSILGCDPGDEGAIPSPLTKSYMRINLLKEPCLGCGRILTQGEWEAAGVCTGCYFKLGEE